MLKQNNKAINSVIRTADVAITAASFYMAHLMRASVEGMPALLPFSAYSYLLVIILPLWAACLRHYGAYKSVRTKSFAHTIWPVVKGSSAALVALMTALYIFKLESVSRTFILAFFTLNTALLCLAKAAIFALLHKIRRKGYNFRTIVMVGTGQRAMEFARLLQEHGEWGLKVVGFIQVGPGERASGIEAPPKGVLGHIRDFREIITATQVDEVVFALPRRQLVMIEDSVLACEKVGIKASIVADFYPHTIAKMEAADVMGWPLMTFNPVASHDRGVFLKRLLDIAFSCAVLTLASPVLIVAAAGIKLTSAGPVFFRQTRCGMNGRRFDVLKFRTMVDGADRLKDRLGHLNEMSGPVFKSKEDPRITPLGRLLRKYSIDELPQFINVLKGDMSIVGPRPPLPSEVDKYDFSQRRRLSVRPGITCLWQVNGRNKLGFSDWVRLDLEYIDKWSFWLDIKIILKTVPAVLKGTGM